MTKNKPNKKNWKKAKKGGRKKPVDPQTRKIWYNVRAPAPFNTATVGLTCVNKRQGLKTPRDSLMGRVCSVSLADLNEHSEQQSWKQFRLQVEDVSGSHCYTQFHGMHIHRYKVTYSIRKWCSLIDAFCEAKTKDGYVLRVFCIGYTHRKSKQVRKTSYASNQQEKMIRKKMVQIIQREVSNCTMVQLIKKLLADQIAEEVQKRTNRIHPLKQVYLYRVKVLQKPKFDFNKAVKEEKQALKALTSEKAKAKKTDESKNALSKETKTE